MKRVISLLITIVLLFSLLTSCGFNNKNDDSEYYEDSFISMDTVITVKLARFTGLYDGEDKKIYFSNEDLAKLVDDLKQICSEVDGKFSRTFKDSFVYQLNDDISYVVGADNEVLTLLSLSLEVANDTKGAFDPTVGTLTDLWNITGGGPKPSNDDIKNALSHVGYEKIYVDEQNVIHKDDSKVIVDLGAIGKGYAAQLMVDYLINSECLYGLISIGGNIGVFGNKSSQERYKIGISDPSNSSTALGYVAIENGFVAVSGDYERYFIEEGVRYHHIFDTSTGYPVDTSLRSVSVISSSAAIADALSTAFFVMGYDSVMEFYTNSGYSFEAVFVFDDNTVLVTPGLNQNDFVITKDNYRLGSQLDGNK